MEAKYKAGDLVQIRASGEIVTINAVSPGMTQMFYSVYQNGKKKRYKEAELIPYVDKEQETLSKLRENRFANAEAFQKYAYYRLFSENQEGNIFSYQGNKILFNPFQYKPLLKFLSVDSDERLLIADEVGVGKTIEAGIIIDELLARGELGSRDGVLIVCPSILCRKWRSELRNKFLLDDFYIHDGKSLTYMLQEILDEEPYESEAWNLLAETYVALEMYPEALEAADFSLAINPQDSDALLMKANAYMSNEQTGAAIEHYTKYLEAQPDDLSVQISLCICYTSEERYKEVLPLLERAEHYARKLPDREADLPQIYQMRAFALSRTGRYAEALAALKKARELGDNKEEWKYDLTEGDIHLQGKQAKKAEQSFATALSKSPEPGDTLFNIALTYSNAGYNEIAIDLLDDVWSIFGTQEGKFVVPYLANCYLRMNDMKSFLEYLKLSPYCDRDATLYLFRDRFPGIAPEDYYAYAYKEVNGFFPESHNGIT